MKMCTKCGDRTDNFYQSQGSWCKPCVRAYENARNQVAGVKERKAQQFRNQYYKRYSMTLAEYEEMFDAQQGLCAACGNPPLPTTRLAVDHDHNCCSGKTSCGKCVRALLCQSCNGALGLVKDDVGTLAKLIAYLDGGAK